MAGKRNRIIELIDYLNSCGIEVNIGKNKARGNKGFFKANGNNFRIDIAKGQTEENILGILAHEFAHFVHYNYDKTLKSLDFIFDMDDELLEELIAITVDTIPKASIQPLFDNQKSLKLEIAHLSKKLNLKDNEHDIEQKIKTLPLKYLLKYDRVKVLEGFSYKIYSVDSLGESSDIELYLKLRSRQRALNRINSRISRLNRYYNSPTELLARSFELYVADVKKLKKIAPRIYDCYNDVLGKKRIPMLNSFVKFFNIC